MFSLIGFLNEYTFPNGPVQPKYLVIWLQWNRSYSQTPGLYRYQPEAVKAKVLRI